MDFRDLIRPLDFRALARPVRFGQARANEVPAPFVQQVCTNRRLAALREAKDVLAHLPGPGEALHVLLTGRFDLCDVVDCLISRVGTVAHVRIATLSFNGRNAQRMAAWTQQGGAVQRLSLLASTFFVRHFKGLFEEVRQTLRPPHAVAHARNHAKLVCLDLASGAKLALESSANLRTNSNVEQAVLTAADALHDWLARYIDTEIAKHGRTQGE
jgi:hypothetical protein